MDQGNFRKGLFMAMGAGICWGTTGLFSTMLFQQGFDPLSVASARIFFTTLVFLFFFLPGRVSRLAISTKELAFLAIFSFIGVTLFNYFYLQAVQQVGISVAVVLLYTSPLFVVFFSSVVLGEPIPRVKLISIGLLLSGTIFVVQAYQVALLRINSTGVLLGLGAGFTFGLLSVFGKIPLVKAAQLTKMFYMFLFGSFFFALFHPPWRLFSHDISFISAFALAGLVLVATFLAYTLYILALSYLEAGKASIAVALEPVAAIVFAFLFFGEVLYADQYLGVLLVLCGIVLISR